VITFGIQNFRCFYRPKPIRLAKITLLVGENSTGKTSFLSALRATIETFKMEDPDFNQAPFNLGSYDQIAHYRNRSRAKEFSFELTEDASPELRKRADEIYKTARRRFDRLKVKVTFIKRSAQPRITTVTISFGSVQITLFIDDKEKYISARTPRGTLSVARAVGDQFSTQFTGLPQLQAMFYFFFHIVSVEEKKKKPPEQDKEKLEEAQFLQSVIHEVIQIVGRLNLEVAAPIRTKPRRTYDPKSERRDPEGEYIPYLLARLNAEKSSEWSKLKDALGAFGVAAGLFDSIEIKRKGASDSDPFQLLVRRVNHSSNLIDVGYGVSQVLPLLTEIILGADESIHLIQQPEVHLHPRAQAEFASFLKDFFSKSPSYCVVETHSDYIVDRIRSHIALGELKREDVSLVFFERREKQVELFQIELDYSGNILNAPKSYRAFFQREIIRTLGIEDVPDS